MSNTHKATALALMVALSLSSFSSWEFALRVFPLAALYLLNSWGMLFGEAK